ncbi:MAG: substrate-binding domain-containing protein, partial [Roseibacillus sp.]|nr:substrate-binding domain-containing protein [Roseibacillus sp.]
MRLPLNDMPKTSPPQSRPPRVAISLEMDWGFKRHQESYAGCQQYADTAGWHCTIEPAIDRVLMGSRGSMPFDGILARATPEIAKAARKKNIPLVNIWLNSPVEELPSVFPDFTGSGILAAEHLLARGFRQLAYLGWAGEVGSRLQAEGMRKVTSRENCNLTTHRFSRTSMEGPARGWEKFVTEIQSWIESWQLPIGLLVCNDIICRYLMDVCRLKGLHISQEVAIVGTYNESEICNAPPPTLTSIDMNCAQVGYRAAA